MKNPGSWFLEVLPLKQTETGMFRKDSMWTIFAYGFNRFPYRVVLCRSSLPEKSAGITPSDIDANDQVTISFCAVPQAEIFPNISQPEMVLKASRVWTLLFIPEERGPYNLMLLRTPIQTVFRFLPVSISAANSKNPSSRWGESCVKLKRQISEASNIRFIQFWMMDPFADGSLNDGTGGDLFINLGSLSEDVLRRWSQEFWKRIASSNE